MRPKKTLTPREVLHIRHHHHHLLLLRQGHTPLHPLRPLRPMLTTLPLLAIRITPSASAPAHTEDVAVVAAVASAGAEDIADVPARHPHLTQAHLTFDK